MLAKDLIKVVHTKYDHRWLRLAGYTIGGPIHDTQTMAYRLNENQLLDLGALVKKYCGYTMDKRIRRVGGRVYFDFHGVDDDPNFSQLIPLDEFRNYQQDSALWRQLREYNRRDLEATRELYLVLRDLLDDTMWASYWRDNDLPFTPVLLDMETAGIPIDLEASEKLRLELEPESVAAQQELRQAANLPESFNIGSGDQLAVYLFNKVFTLKDSLRIGADACGALKSCLAGEHDDCTEDAAWNPKDGLNPDVHDAVLVFTLHVKDLLPDGFTIDSVGRDIVHGYYTLRGRGLRETPPTESGNRPATSTPVLMMWHAGDEWVRDLIAWRKIHKVLTTYLRNFPKQSHGGRLYGRFNQTGTKTGRLSSSGPNLQNIPARGDLGPRVRALFRGNLLVGDYSQLEPRLMAHFSGDPVLLDAYEHGHDVYRITAHAIWSEWVEKADPRREIGKVVFLGSQYGAGYKKLAMILALSGYPTSWDQAKAYQDAMEQRYHVLYEWKDAIHRHVKQRGYVTTLSGAHRRLKHQFKEKWNWKQVGYGERQAVNAIIQGSAGDIVRRAMIEASTQIDWRLLFQVHDEVGYDWTNQGRPTRPQLATLAEIYEEPALFYGLRVPLVFEPHVVATWAEKGSAALDPEAQAEMEEPE